MSPATFVLVLQGIQAAIEAAPQIEAIAIKGKEMINTLFTNNLITAEVQAAARAHVDAIQEAALRGEVPPHWTVEADPA